MTLDAFPNTNLKINCIILRLDALLCVNSIVDVPEQCKDRVVLVKTVAPSSMCFMMGLSIGSTTVYLVMRDHVKVPTFSMSVRIDAIRARFSILWVSVGLSVEPESVGCLDVASVARLHFQCRYCFERNKREMVILSSMWSPKIFTSGLWSVTLTRL